MGLRLRILLMGEFERAGLPRAEVLHLTPLEFSASGPLESKLFMALGTQPRWPWARLPLSQFRHHAQ